MTIEFISRDKCYIPEDGHRKVFDEADLERLSLSIQNANVGLINPIQVKMEDDGRARIVSGRRRFKALGLIDAPYLFSGKIVEADQVPVTLHKSESALAMEEAELFENVERVDLTWAERVEAEARIHKLMQQKNPDHTLKDTATMVTKHRDAEGTPAPKNSEAQRVQRSLLISNHLDNPQVAGAKSERAAYAAASKAAEDTFTELLIRRRAEKEAAGEDKAHVPSVADLETESAGTISLEQLMAEEAPPEIPDTFERLTHDGNILYNADMMKKLQELEPGTFDMLLTDPPYGINTKGFGGAAQLETHYADDEEMFEQLHEHMVEQFDKLAKANATAYVFCKFDYFLQLLSMFEDWGWWVQPRPLIWFGGAGQGHMITGDSVGYKATYECILYAVKGVRPCNGVLPDVLQVSPPSQKTNHAQKPVALYEMLMKQSLAPGELVLDPFAGSGTIFKAARRFGARAVGIEKSPAVINHAALGLTGAVPNDKD